MSNLALRTITAVVFGAVMVCGLLLHPLGFLILLLAIMLMGMKEFYDISLGGKFKLQCKLAVIAGVVALLSVFGFLEYGFDIRFAAISLLVLLLIPITCIFDKDHKDFDQISLVYTGFVYVALPIALAPYMVLKAGFFNGLMLLSLFIIIWVSDIGAYFLGSSLGQKPDSKKLAPLISPKKSWWGFWGGLILGIVAAIGLYFLKWLPYNFIHCVALGVVVCVFGVCGDLVESLWKRRYGVKDSGNCIPGHGGMLDRFDSSLIAIPAAAVYLTIFGLL